MFKYWKYVNIVRFSACKNASKCTFYRTTFYVKYIRIIMRSRCNDYWGILCHRIKHENILSLCYPLLSGIYRNPFKNPIDFRMMEQELISRFCLTKMSSLYNVFCLVLVMQKLYTSLFIMFVLCLDPTLVLCGCTRWATEQVYISEKPNRCSSLYYENDALWKKSVLRS